MSPRAPLHDDQRAFVLASASPRRRDWMRRIGFEPLARPSRIEEVAAPGESGAAYAARLARAKALEVAADAEPGAWVLGADTVVLLDDAILEKPADRADAARMLSSLSGRAHSVVTAFAWVEAPASVRAEGAVETVVHFRALAAETIERYVASGEPMDKAGAYGIQGIASVFIERIEGSYDAVVGLPSAEIVAALRDAGGLAHFPFAPTPSVPG